MAKKGEVVSSIMDLVNFVPITNRIYEKKVILVFDDLERTNISCTDLLGCINDYCENQSFNTIIVANEEKIKDMISFASAAASIVTTKKGAICSMPEIEEVEKLRKKYE